MHLSNRVVAVVVETVEKRNWLTKLIFGPPVRKAVTRVLKDRTTGEIGVLESRELRSHESILLDGHVISYDAS